MRFSEHPVLVVGWPWRLFTVGIRVHPQCLLRDGIHAGADVADEASGRLQGKTSCFHFGPAHSGSSVADASREEAVFLPSVPACRCFIMFTVQWLCLLMSRVLPVLY